MIDEDKKQEFMRAYGDMQNELPLIEKDTKAFNYKYAPLEAILEKWNPIFSKHDFVMVQSTVAGSDGADIVCTELNHLPTGGNVSSSLTIPVSDDYQKVGSGITYYRRYTLITCTGQQPVGEDFDGLKEIASKSHVAEREAREVKKRVVPTVEPPSIPSIPEGAGNGEIDIDF